MYTCKYIGFCTHIFRKNTPSFSLPLKIRPHSTYHCSTAHTNTLMMQCMVSFRRAGRHCTMRKKMAMPAWRRCWSSTEPHGRRALRGMREWRGGAWVECHSIFPAVVQSLTRPPSAPHTHRWHTLLHVACWRSSCFSLYTRRTLSLDLFSTHLFYTYIYCIFFPETRASRRGQRSDRFGGLEGY